MKNLCYPFILCLISLSAFAQPENPVIEQINGTNYYVHIVQGGNTLYGICKLYNIPAERVIDENPTAAQGLQIGQKIIIPVDQVNAKVLPPQKSPATHTVQKSETLYGISKKYNVSMEDMVKLNPGIENGISIGQVLNIPDYGKMPVEAEVIKVQNQVTFTDSTILYTVLQHETLYSLSRRFMVSVDELKKLNNMSHDRIRKGDVLKIPMKNEKVTRVEIRQVEEVKNKQADEELTFKSKDQYRIVYLLPFNLDGSADNIRDITTEFYMGAQLALDSLERLGLNAIVNIVDVASDSTKFKAQLETKELKNADLIIGPFSGKNVEIAANWAKRNKVRMVSPLFSSTTILKDNMYVYNAVNSDVTLIEGSARYLAENKSSDQIVLVKVDNKDDELYQAFRRAFLKYAGNSGKVKLIECNQDDMANYFRKGGNTILVVPSRDKVFATRFMNNLHQLSSRAGSGTISVFATKDWANNDEIKAYYKNRYNLHYASPYDFNYSYDATKRLLRKYRVKYNADLTKYGTQGFDVSMYFIQEFFLNKNKTVGVMNNISLQNALPGSGFENKTCFILKQQDYEIKQLVIINE